MKKTAMSSDVAYKLFVVFRWTSLIIASSAGHEAVVRLLIGAGADVDACTDQGRSSLLYACSRNRQSIARLLLQVPFL